MPTSTYIMNAFNSVYSWPLHTVVQDVHCPTLCHPQRTQYESWPPALHNIWPAQLDWWPWFLAVRLTSLEGIILCIKWRLFVNARPGPNGTVLLEIAFQGEIQEEPAHGKTFLECGKWPSFKFLRPYTAQQALFPNTTNTYLCSHVPRAGLNHARWFLTPE